MWGKIAAPPNPWLRHTQKPLFPSGPVCRIASAANGIRRSAGLPRTMAPSLRGLPWCCLWLFLGFVGPEYSSSHMVEGQQVHQVLLVSACQDANFSALIQKRCLTRFQEDMEALGKDLWCDWDKTVRRLEECRVGGMSRGCLVETRLRACAEAPHRTRALWWNVAREREAPCDGGFQSLAGGLQQEH
ncbi:receptor activity-modifying protein 1 isoform X3 [Marmota marmota marmota]|uniref:receptor activity-modifying protein 1 isoform X3 n=1 Tax=Marmota marmota marmota TaxID=9994 RepID=UPI0020933AC5|nr:receptor activity-modifying protein 1 isoform X3 [Marmota marmota marmota]